jgi:hypothetical protein
LKAFRELETLVRHLGEELAMFRRRALAAEAQLKNAGREPAKARAASADHADVDAENRALKTRVERAEDRVRQLMDRVRFLRQQIQLTSTLPVGRS